MLASGSPGDGFGMQLMSGTDFGEGRPARFVGRTAVVTGGAGHIGRGIVRRLLDEGASVAMVDNDEGLIADAVAELNVGERLHVIEADVTGDAAAMLRDIAGVVGEPDVLVCAAGIIPTVPWSSTTRETWDATLDVNLTAPFNWTAAACRRWVGSRPGVVVHVVSIEAIAAFPNQVAYAASKAGLAGLIRAFAVDLADAGVRVCGVGPGTVPNPRVPGPDQGWEPYIRDVPLGRLGKPEDIGAAVAFLASDDASWVTGEILYVDGGYVAR